MSERILWSGAQWKVLESGLDTLDDKYFIAANRLWEAPDGWTWENQLSEKTWIDLADFREAIAWAREHFNHLKPSMD